MNTDDLEQISDTARRMAAAHRATFGDPPPREERTTRPALIVQNRRGEFFTIVEDETGIIRIHPVTL